jgi:hypothetical protein
MRTPQQNTGDEVEAAALQLVQEFFPEASLTKGSGNLHGDGDVEGAGQLFIDCKGSEKPGRGRSVPKKDWEKIKAQALKWNKIPVHVGFDDDGELVALISLKHLVASEFLCKKVADEKLGG